MRIFAYLGMFMLSMELISGCQKDINRNQPVVSLQLINAVIGGSNVNINANEQDSVLLYNAKPIGLSIVNNETFIQVQPTVGSEKPYYSNKVPAQMGDVYSLFLFGLQGTVESLLIKEQIPGWYTDSVMGVRVAHLSLGSGNINITLKKDPTMPIIKEVGYKTVSGIVKIPLPRVIPSGTASFEVRDARDNKILATYNLPVNPSQLYPGISVALQRFKNITLVIKGSRDTLSGPNAFGVFPAAVSY